MKPISDIKIIMIITHNLNLMFIIYKVKLSKILKNDKN